MCIRDRVVYRQSHINTFPYFLRQRKLPHCIRRIDVYKRQDEDCVMEPGQNLRQTLDILAGKVPVAIPELPSRLDALMRPYQKEGFSFLYRITERGFGACLADDRGLGKTLQAIAWPVSYTHLDVYKRQAISTAIWTIAQDWPHW